MNKKRKTSRERITFLTKRISELSIHSGTVQKELDQMGKYVSDCLIDCDDMKDEIKKFKQQLYDLTFPPSVSDAIAMDGRTVAHTDNDITYRTSESWTVLCSPTGWKGKALRGMIRLFGGKLNIKHEGIDFNVHS